MIYEFKENDKFVNVLVSYPRYEIRAYSGSLYLNNFKTEGTSQSQSLNLVDKNISNTYISSSTLYNLDGSIVYSVSGTLTGGYFGRYYLITDSNGIEVPQYSQYKAHYILNSLCSLMNKKRINSYSFSQDKYFSSVESSALKNSFAYNVLALSSLLYGTQINPGTVELKFNITGSTISCASDSRKNCEIICTSPASLSGTTIGVVFYDEGYIVLTSSATISTATQEYYKQPTSSLGSASIDNPKWIYFGSHQNISGSATTAIVSSSYELIFEGVNKIPVLTLFSHLPKGECTWSNNQTFMSSSWITSSHAPQYIESEFNQIYNTKNSGITNYSASFESQAFISNIVILDEQKTPIMLCSLAKNTQKKSKDSFSVKMQLDI